MIKRYEIVAVPGHPGQYEIEGEETENLEGNWCKYSDVQALERELELAVRRQNANLSSFYSEGKDCKGT